MTWGGILNLGLSTDGAFKKSLDNIGSLIDLSLVVLASKQCDHVLLKINAILLRQSGPAEREERSPELVGNIRVGMLELAQEAQSNPEF